MSEKKKQAYSYMKALVACRKRQDKEHYPDFLDDIEDIIDSWDALDEPTIPLKEIEERCPECHTTNSDGGHAPHCDIANGALRD
jgi:hypothetical protein